MSARTFINTTTENYQGNNGVDKGAIHYVPVFGPRGFYLILGGITASPSDLDNSQGELIDFETVSVCDRAKREWWNDNVKMGKPVYCCGAGV